MDNQPFIGRATERQLLGDALDSPRAELVAIIGRRRIGKTYLVRTCYAEALAFQITGIQHAPLKEQLYHFHQQLQRQGGQVEHIPTSWLEAFSMLMAFLESLPSAKKHVVFFDELPWLDTTKSGFLRALSAFWNDWAAMRQVVVVICGSAASWMIKKVIEHKGGLHNRVTRLIRLLPFTLHETQTYLHSLGVRYDQYQTALLYMVTGGIPFYLQAAIPGLSANQNIAQLCFRAQGLLAEEFYRLYASLFDTPERYLKVIRALSSKWKGMSRQELVDVAQLPDSGALTMMLKELELSGFITSYSPFGKKKKDTIYRLTDPYSLFYLKFMTEQPAEKSWDHILQTAKWHTWAGYAFENLCMLHIAGIRSVLGISGIHSHISSFYSRGNGTHGGMQIDLLIDRADNCINICEIKFATADYAIDKQYALVLRNRIETFRSLTKTRKHLFLTFITTFGITQNIHSTGLIDQQLSLDALFHVIAFE